MRFFLLVFEGAPSAVRIADAQALAAGAVDAAVLDADFGHRRLGHDVEVGGRRRREDQIRRYGALLLVVDPDVSVLAGAVRLPRLHNNLIKKFKFIIIIQNIRMHDNYSNY